MRLRTFVSLAVTALVGAVVVQVATAKPARNERTLCSPSYTTAVKTCVTGPITVTTGGSASYAVELINKTSATLDNVQVTVQELGLTTSVRSIRAGRSESTSFDTTVPAQTGDYYLTF